MRKKMALLLVTFSVLLVISFPAGYSQWVPSGDGGIQTLNHGAGAL